MPHVVQAGGVISSRPRGVEQPAGAAAGAGYAAAVMALTPDLYWKLDETSGTTAADSSGNSHPGTYGAGATLNQASILPTDTGKSVLFDNSGAGKVTSSLALNTWNGTRKLFTSWVRLESNSGNSYLAGDDAAAGGFVIGSGTTSVKFDPQFGTGATWSNSPFSTGANHMVALDFDEVGNLARLWVDNVLQQLTPVDATTDIPLTGTWPSANLQIGATASFAGWDGRMQHVAVFTGRTSPAADVAALYAAA